MIGLYKAIVGLLESKAAVEQAKAISILDDCGIKMAEPDAAEAEKSAEAEFDSWNASEVRKAKAKAAAGTKGHAVGFTGRLIPQTTIDVVN